MIALAAGGALDTVIDGQTGVLFARQQVDCLIEAVRRIEQMHWDSTELRTHALRFDRGVFHQQLREFVAESLAAHGAGRRFA